MTKQDARKVTIIEDTSSQLLDIQFKIILESFMLLHHHKGIARN